MTSGGKRYAWAMGFESIGITGLIVILVVALLVFGPKRLPEIGHSLGKGIREFKRSVSDIGSSAHEEIPRAPLAQQPHDSPKQAESEPKRLIP